MIDGFPLEAGDPDFEIQLSLTRMERPGRPQGQGPQARQRASADIRYRVVDKVLDGGDDRKLPDLFAARPRSNLADAAVRRIAWNHAGAPRASHG